MLKVETKADSSYMIVAGIQERSQQRRKSTDVLINKFFLFQKKRKC